MVGQDSLTLLHHLFQHGRTLHPTEQSMELLKSLDEFKQLLHGKTHHGMVCRMKQLVQECVEGIWMFRQFSRVIIQEFFNDEQGAIGNPFGPVVQLGTDYVQYLLDLQNMLLFTERLGKKFFQFRFALICSGIINLVEQRLLIFPVKDR